MNNRPMRMWLRRLEEPNLIFGGNNTHHDPKHALVRFGPFSFESGLQKVIKLGLVAPESEIDGIHKWFQRLNGPLIDSVQNVLKFPNFPGLPNTYRCKFEFSDAFTRILPERELAFALAQNDHDKFDSLLRLYSETIGTLFGDIGPDVVIVAFSEEVAELRVRNKRIDEAEFRSIRQRQKDEDRTQLSLFDNFSEKEVTASSELFPHSEELLSRNFHRALKAKCMVMRNAVPLQIIRQHTYLPTAGTQNEATRAFNLTTALYYKASNTPWQPAGLQSGTCFVGISFHYMKRKQGEILFASLAQAFSTDTEPFAIQGEPLSDHQVRDKQPYLEPEQAERIARKVVDQFKFRTGIYPSKLVIHKTSKFQKEEIDGFKSATKSAVPSLEMVWMRPTGFRLISDGRNEVERGMFIDVERTKRYLFTTGYVTWWKEYPGPHVPSPLELTLVDDGDLEERALEILTLCKMNWNSADGLGRHPITISFARHVGAIMTEVPDGVEINPSYRFYM